VNFWLMDWDSMVILATLPVSQEQESSLSLPLTTQHTHTRITHTYSFAHSHTHAPHFYWLSLTVNSSLFQVFFFTTFIALDCSYCSTVGHSSVGWMWHFLIGLYFPFRHIHLFLICYISCDLVASVAFFFSFILFHLIDSAAK
jgi:hypothetical protein